MHTRDELVAGIDYVRAAIADLDTAAEAREWTDEERASWDAGYAYCTETAAQVAAIDEREAQRAQLAELANLGRSIPGDTRPVPNVNTRTGGNPFDVSTLDRFSPSFGSEVRARAIDAIEKGRGWYEDDHKEGATQKVEMLGNSNRAAEQILASIDPNYRAAFGKLQANAAGHHVDLTSEERGASERADQILRDSGFWQPVNAEEARALALTNVTGKLVPGQLDPSVIMTSSLALDPFRQLARVIPVSTNVWTGVTSAGITGGWTGSEASEVDDDTPTFVNPTVTCYMADAFVPMSFQAYEDWSGAESELMVMLNDYKFTLEEAAHATGTGSSQPIGIVTALAGTTSIVSCATNSSFTVADLLSLKQALPARYKPRGQYAMNEAYSDRIRQFGTATGSLFTVDLSNSDVERLLGKPAHLSTTMSGALGTTTNYAIVYGDWSNFVIADRIGMVVEFIPNLFHTGANRPSASRGYLAHWRTGSDSVNDSGFRMLQNQGVF